MIFTADTKEFAAALATAGRVIPAKSPWPILLNVKLVTNDNRVTLIGSNGDSTVEIDVPATVDTEGAAALPFAPFVTFCRVARSETVRVEIAEDAAKVSSGRNRIGLMPAAVADFPNFTPPDGDPVKVDKDTFVTALRFCLAAVEDSEVKYHIAGVNFAERDGEIEVFGTDGMTMHRAGLTGLTEIGGGGTLPHEAAQTAVAALDKAKSAAFMICPTGYHLAADNCRMWGKVIDGTYPDTRRVLEQFGDWRDVCTGAKEDWSAALSVATCGADKGSDKARALVLRADDGNPLVLRGHRAVGGVVHAGRAELETVAKSGIAVAVSSRHLSCALTGIDTDDISISVARRGGDGGEALSVRPAQENAVLSLSALIMSMRASKSELADV